MVFNSIFMRNIVQILNVPKTLNFEIFWIRTIFSFILSGIRKTNQIQDLCKEKDFMNILYLNLCSSCTQTFLPTMSSHLHIIKYEEFRFLSNDLNFRKTLGQLDAKESQEVDCKNYWIITYIDSFVSKNAKNDRKMNPFAQYTCINDPTWMAMHYE